MIAQDLRLVWLERLLGMRSILLLAEVGTPLQEPDREGQTRRKHYAQASIRVSK